MCVKASQMSAYCADGTAQGDYMENKKNKTALITGASRGIGAACARALAEDGFKIIINYNHSADAAHKLAEELGGIALQADVSDRNQVQAMFERAGGVDVLVCNAGIALQKLFSDTTPEEWQHIFADGSR